MKRLLALAFLLVASPALAQTCPTRPAGDNSNACASTAFVHNATGGFSGFANPTAQVGNTVVNGSATTAMRSDAAPPLASGAASANIGTLGGVLGGTLPNPTMAAGAAATNIGSLSGDLSGTLPSPTVAKIQGTAVVNTAPANAQALTYDGPNSRWAPVQQVINVAQYVPTPTSNDSTAFQSAATACGAFSGGCTLICPTGVTYTIQNVTLSSGTTVRGCTLKQFSAGNPIFSISSVSNVRVIDSQFTGNQVTTGLAAAVSGDSPINVLSSSHVEISGNYFTAFGLYATLIQNSNDIIWNRNRTFGVAFGPRCRGGPSVAAKQNFVFANNILEQTALYSLTPTANQFAVGFGFDSSDPIGGVSYGQCQNVTIANNVIKDFPYSQAILIHSGKNFSITGNTATNVSICISANPFNSTDSAILISIVGNTCDGTSASSLPTSSDVGIVAQGGGTTGVTQLITIANNVLQAFNRVSSDTGTGCILIGYSTNVSATGNVLKGCGQNGIVLTSAEDAFNISGNVINATVGGSQVGIHGFSTSAIGYIIGNQLESLGTGILFPGATAGVNYATNHCSTVTTCTSP